MFYFFIIIYRLFFLSDNRIQGEFQSIIITRIYNTTADTENGNEQIIVVLNALRETILCFLKYE